MIQKNDIVFAKFRGQAHPQQKGSASKAALIPDVRTSQRSVLRHEFHHLGGLRKNRWATLLHPRENGPLRSKGQTGPTTTHPQ